MAYTGYSNFAYPEVELEGSGGVINSYPVYADLAFADRYQAARLYNKAWTGASALDKLKSLKMGTDVVDSAFYWLGQQAFPNQPLDFPRTGIYKAGDGAIVSYDGIPLEIQKASAEMAFELLRDGDLSSAASKGTSASTATTLDKVKVGSIEVDFRNSATTDQLIASGVYLSEYVSNLVHEFVDYSIAQTGLTNQINFRLVRLTRV